MIKMQSKENTAIKESLKDFINYNKAKNLADATLYYYRKKLKRFTDYLVDEEGLTETNQIEGKTIEKYIMYLQSEWNLNNTSINTHLRAVKVYCNYLIKLGYIKHSFQVELLKTQDKVKETYTEKELKVLLEKPDMNECNFATYRSWVVINTLIATGLRLKSIVNLKIKDLDFENEMISINVQKNKTASLIPMSRTLKKVLQDYLTIRKGEDDDYLFCSIYETKLKRSSMRNAIKRYHKRRGIMKTSIHAYRHTFAKMTVMEGIDPLRLQKLLNHRTLDMTKQYVNLFNTDLKEGFNSYNPLENLKGKKSPLNLKE